MNMLGARGSISANERLKGSFDPLVWGGIVAAVIVHLAAFLLWPGMRAPGISAHGEVAVQGVQDVAIPPDVKIPAAPGALARPATPVIASSAVPENVTIPKMDVAALDAGALPTPPSVVTGGGGRSGSSENASGHPTFTPSTVPPELLNPRQVVRAMRRYYPRVYRETRIGGVVLMYLYIDERGRVQHERVARSSGYPKLDSAAVKVAKVYRFRPLLDKDRKAAIWVQIPIVFSVTAGGGGDP